MKILVVGAGVSGLTASYELAKKGHDITVIEKEKKVGGLARSFYYDGFTFDIGPHRFYSLNENILKFIFKIGNHKFKEISRKSDIWMFNKYFKWPFSMYNVFKLPFPKIVKIAYDHLYREKFIELDENFENYIQKIYGPTIYNIFFKPYTEKFLKESPTDIDKSWAKLSIDRALIDKRININSIFLLLKIALLPNINTTFYYPKYKGIQKFCTSLEKKLKELNTNIFLNTTVNGIIRNSSFIGGVRTTQREFTPDVVIWTAPITLLASLLNLPTYNLSYLSTICYNICLIKSLDVEQQWCYYSSENISFSRLTFPENFSKNNVPKGKSSICAEVTVKKGQKEWDKPEILKSKVIKDLEKVDIINNAQEIEKVRVERVENSYPIYMKGFKDKVTRLVNKFGQYNNLFLLGRTAQFWYNNMDESIAKAFEISKVINDKYD